MKRIKRKILVAFLLTIAAILCVIFFVLDKEKVPNQANVMEKGSLATGSSPSPGEEKTLYEKIEQALEDIDKIGAYYEAGQYKKARALLDKVRHKVFDESPDFGMEYPTSVTLNLKFFDRLLEDEEGYYDDFPSFAGMAREVMGGTTGCFTVVGKEETMPFIYERDVLIQGDEDTGISGNKVTVYYEGPDAWDSYTALKIVVHPKGEECGD